MSFTTGSRKISRVTSRAIIWTHVEILTARAQHCCTATFSLQWRHNARDGISNHRGLDSLLLRLFRRRSSKTPKLRVTGLSEGNPPVTGGFPPQRASNAENVHIWWRHHTMLKLIWWLAHVFMCIWGILRLRDKSSIWRLSVKKLKVSNSRRWHQNNHNPLKFGKRFGKKMTSAKFHRDWEIYNSNVAPWEFLWDLIIRLTRHWTRRQNQELRYY